MLFTRGVVLLPVPQSVMLVELDGPRKRTVGIQVVGQTGASNNGAGSSS